MSNLTPHDVITTLEQISRDIQTKTDELAALDEACVRRRVAQKKAYARAFMSVEGAPMDVRRYTADLETSQTLLEFELAEQLHRACQGALRASRDRLEVGRSISALVRMEWSLQS